MSALPQHPDRLVRVPMGFEAYLALPEGARAEYVDAMAIVSPAPMWRHQRIARRLANTIEAAIPALWLVEATGVWTGEARSRIPDVLATTEPYDGSWAPGPPVLVAEVLSPSTRREDLVRKSGEYRDAGIAQYWIVDPDERSVTVLGSSGAGWDVLFELDADHPAGSVAVGTHGTVTLELEALLAP